jgi:hypothetical protein
MDRIGWFMEVKEKIGMDSLASRSSKDLNPKYVWCPYRGTPVGTVV